MDLEQQLRREFAARTSAPPNPADLADRVIVRAAGVRRRRIVAVASAAVVVVVVALAVGLMRTPRPAPVAGPPPPDQVLPELSNLPVGAPPKVAVYGPHTLRLPTGAELRINTTGAERVTWAGRAAGGWLVETPRQDGLMSLWVIRDNGVPMWGAEGVLSWAVSRDGSRIALQTKETRAKSSVDKVDVYDFAVGRWGGSTALPASSGHGLRVSGWTGSLVVLTSGSTEDFATVDVWDPAKGPYRPVPFPLRLIGADAEQHQLIGFELGAEGAAGCLVRVDPAAGFAVTARSCDTKYPTGETFPFRSPDGSRLVLWRPELDGELFVLDVSTMAPVPPRLMVPLPKGILVGGVLWEDDSTVLLQVVGKPHRLNLMRCRLVEGSRCERVPVPQVDGADPLGIAR